MTKDSMSLIPHPKIANAQAHVQVAVTQPKSEGAEASEYSFILAQLVRTACADIVQSFSQDDPFDFEQSGPLTLSESEGDTDACAQFSAAENMMAELAAIGSCDPNSTTPPNQTVWKAMKKMDTRAKSVGSHNLAVDGAKAPGRSLNKRSSATCWQHFDNH